VELRPVLFGYANGVGHQHVAHRGVAQLFAHASHKQPMRGRDYDFGPRTRRQQGLDAFGDCAAGGDHVVNDQAREVRYVSHNVSDPGLGSAHALRVQDDDGSAQTLRIAACHWEAPDIGRDHHDPGRQSATQGLTARRHRGQAVHRKMKKAFNLRRMQAIMTKCSMPTTCRTSATNRAMIGSRRPLCLSARP
jgi:hypothetical protein